jgi:hypothetical protein
MMDFDKTPSNDAESIIGSDEEDFTKKKQRSSIDDDLDFGNDDLDETNPRNIWRKRRKFSNNHQISTMMETDITKIEQNNSNNNQINTTNDYQNVDKYPNTNSLYIRPHDHQVPTTIPGHHDDSILMANRLFRIKKKDIFYYKNSFVFLVDILYQINSDNHQ